MIKVGTIKALWRYPVKGMAGESLEQSEVSEQGLLGDRVWALRDVARQEIQSCKFRPDLLRCAASFRKHFIPANGVPVDITLPDGRVVGSDDRTIHAILSQLTGHASTLESLRSIDELHFYHRYKKDNHTWLTELKATFEREVGEPLPDLDNLPEKSQTFISIPGTFFLVSPLHFVTTATIDYLKKQTPDADWSMPRFRPNVVIETAPEFTGLVEQNWIGRRLHINQIMVDCSAAAPRCGAITKPQQGFGVDTQVLRTVIAKADQNVGIYGEASNKGVISVGEAVFLD
jgi:uncharacterized protein